MPGSRSLLRPFRRDKKADFAAGDILAAVQSAVGQILGTIAASDFTPGELPWNPGFGSLLHLLRNRKADATLQEIARTYVVDALRRWEPRVRVTSVKVTHERAQGEDALAIRLRYDIVASPGQQRRQDLELVLTALRARRQ